MLRNYPRIFSPADYQAEDGFKLENVGQFRCRNAVKTNQKKCKLSITWMSSKSPSISSVCWWEKLNGLVFCPPLGWYISDGRNDKSSK